MKQPRYFLSACDSVPGRVVIPGNKSTQVSGEHLTRGKACLEGPGASRGPKYGDNVLSG